MNYQALVESIAALHTRSAGHAVATVSQALVLRNWVIGAYIIAFEQNGEDRARYGQCLLHCLYTDLSACGLKGVSPDMLDRMRLFVRHYPQVANAISAPLVRNFPSPAQHLAHTISAPVRKSITEGPAPLPVERILRLSWTQLAAMVRLDDPWKRAFYEIECLNGNWSKRQLQRQIGSLLYERTALSTDNAAVIARARRQSTESAAPIADLIRDPYVLEFVGLPERPAYTENELESALLDHLHQFLLELGTGFCFEARQRRITVANEHNYIDLVFYHRRLRCNLLIDLKVRPFRHCDAGQMNYYLNYWTSNEIDRGDNPPVGLLLCSGKEATQVEYATAGMDQQPFGSRYLVALRSAAQLRSFIEADRAALEFAEARRDNVEDVHARYEVAPRMKFPPLAAAPLRVSPDPRDSRDLVNTPAQLPEARQRLARGLDRVARQIDARLGVVTPILGLQDAYALLAGLNDPLGERFQQAGFGGTRSPLTVRNQSILAHGFERVSESVFDNLWRATLELTGVSENDLPRFPRLGERQSP